LYKRHSGGPVESKVKGIRKKMIQNQTLTDMARIVLGLKTGTGVSINDGKGVRLSI
jgi:hypothetical protein